MTIPRFDVESGDFIYFLWFADFAGGVSLTDYAAAAARIFFIRRAHPLDTGAGWAVEFLCIGVQYIAARTAAA